MVVLQKAVIDTGVLFTVLLLNYIRQAYLPDPKHTNTLAKLDDRELQFSEHRQEAYLRLLSGIRTPLITSHVIGELQGLQISRLQLHGEDLRHFWMHSVDYLLTRSFDERLVRLLDVSGTVEWRETVGSVGPPDTGLIHLALAERCPLLTDDARTLAGRARQAGVECFLARELVNAYP